jgi:tetratricopeptide (TPR) repeat protein
MADRGPLVIWMDDLQWGDLDSIAFISELVLSANAPALLLILSFRSEQAASNRTLGALRSLEQQAKGAESWLNLQLAGLSDEEGRELLGLLHPEGVSMNEEQSEQILRDSRGSPMLLAELLRFTSRDSAADDASQTAPGRLLSDMIRHRASTLSATARELLEALSVAGEPMAKATLFRTVRVTDEDPARALGLLMQDRLVRVSGGAPAGHLEPFHDQVREASLSWLSPKQLQDWHAHLAELFAAEEEPDPQRLLRHYRGAGNWPAAFASALGAAKSAENALAFDQAARFYAEALETGEGDEAAQATVYRKRAEALAKAGRGYEAGQCYLAAARWPQQNDTIEMRRLAAEQLMRGGYLDEGTQIFADLLRSAGIKLPASPLASVLRMLALRAFIRMRGLRWRERAEADIPAARLRKLDLLWNGAMVMTTGDPILGTYLQARHMLEALRTGEPSRLALSFGLGGFYESARGRPESKRSRHWVHLSLSLAERLDDPYLLAMAYGFSAALDYLCGRIDDGLTHIRIGQSRLDLAGRSGRAWETVTADLQLTWFLSWGGRIRELCENVPRILQEGRSRGDVYADVTLRCSAGGHLVHLAADDPGGAIAETTRAIQQWRKTRYDVQHFGATISCIDADLYAGRTAEARRRILSAWPAIRRSLYTRKCQILRTTLFFARGRTALAEWLRDPSARELRVETEQFAARLGKLHSPWGDALSKLLRAGIMAGLKRPAEAILLLAQAEEILRQQDLRLLAAATLRRRGELEGPAGIQRIEAADAFMRSETILRPDRMTAMILPGAWL